MHIISVKKLRQFWNAHKDVEQDLKEWYAKTEHMDRVAPEDIKLKHKNASFIANNRVVFNIKGNKYRLVVQVNYKNKVVYIRFIGTHSEYDRIDAEKI